MRQNIFVSSFLTLVGCFLVPALSHGAETAVGGSPLSYYAPQGAAIGNLNDQVKSGIIPFPQFKAGIDALEHHVNLSPDENAVPVVSLDTQRARRIVEASLHLPKAAASDTTWGQNMCAPGYSANPYGPNNVICEQDIQNPDNSVTSNIYFMANGRSEFFRDFYSGKFGVHTSFNFGIWYQLTPKGNYVNFFAASQGQSDLIYQQAKANNWSVTQSISSQGFYQVHALFGPLP